ncbi:MAG: bifunctional nuclease family protein [Spirochaetes bacterium]|nr:bifunctional nuclease family protein [Spirochaetota bacterium]
MIEVRIKNISITDIGFVVFLRREGDDRVLPIFIGPVEAQAITTILLKQAGKRPMTHDLFAAVLKEAEWKVVRVEITEIKNETFYAVLVIQQKKYALKGSDKTLRSLDARPSDAIALALRHEAPIFVADKLLADHGVFLAPEEAGGETPKAGADMGITKKLNDQLGVFHKALDEAVREERFEDADKIRKQINQLIGLDN